MTLQLSQSAICNTDYRIVDVHNKQVVVDISIHKVIGYAKNGKFCQDDGLVMRTLQNSYDLNRVWGLG